VNPYAEELTFQDGQTRTRRDHMKYLTLIRAVALLFQHQREVKVVDHGGESAEYIEATRADVELARRIGDEVLGRSFDELPPVTRKVLEVLEALVAARADAEGIALAEVRFTQREVREASAFGHTQLKVHLKRLAELEYVLAHRGPRGQGFVYELAVVGAEAKRLAPGRGAVGGGRGAGADHGSSLFSAANDASAGTGRPQRVHSTGTRNGSALSYAKS
jgi:hypothetical protein